MKGRLLEIVGAQGSESGGTRVLGTALPHLRCFQHVPPPHRIRRKTRLAARELSPFSTPLPAALPAALPTALYAARRAVTCYAAILRLKPRALPGANGRARRYRRGGAAGLRGVTRAGGGGGRRGERLPPLPAGLPPPSAPLPPPPLPIRLRLPLLQPRNLRPGYSELRGQHSTQLRGACERVGAAAGGGGGVRGGGEGGSVGGGLGGGTVADEGQLLVVSGGGKGSRRKAGIPGGGYPGGARVCSCRGGGRSDGRKGGGEGVRLTGGVGCSYRGGLEEGYVSRGTWQGS